MMAESPFSRDRWVRIEADFGARGVWNRDCVACNPDWLPVSVETVAHIRAWQEAYDDIMIVFERMDPEELDRRFCLHWCEAFDIANELKAQLPDWTVVVGAAPYEYQLVRRAERRARPTG